MKFEWDLLKAETNITKHNVSFENAALVFSDKDSLSIYDEEHSDREERWITLGRTSDGVLLVVVHTYRKVDKEEYIRIISARKAGKKEANQYYERNKG